MRILINKQKMTNFNNNKIVFTSIRNYTTFVFAKKWTVLLGCYTYVVYKVIMCPDPYFWYHSINDYGYNNLKKSEAVLAWKKRILK